MKLLLIFITSLLIISCKESDTSSAKLSSTIPGVEGYKLVWNDEFNGNTLDLTKWSYQIGTGSEYGLNGWGNNELQYYTDNAKNISVSDGILQITALNSTFENSAYTSARISSAGVPNGNWKYGLFEAKIKLPVGKGLWPAFWMLPEDNVYGGWPKSGEIDIMEAVMHIPNETHGTVHYGQAWPNNSYSGKGYSLPSGNLNDEFHIYKVAWEENKITWFIDDLPFYHVTPDTLAPEQWPFDQNFHLLLNLAVGGNWPGNPDSTTTFPQVMEVDFVRVYQKVK